MIRLCAFSDEADASLSGQIDALHRNAIALTELRSVGGKNVSKLTEREAKEIYNTLKQEGIAVWALGSPLGKAEIDVDFTQYLEEVKHVCALACALGTDKIRAFSFFHAEGQRQKVLDRLNRMAETAKAFGVTLYHENEKEIYGDIASRVFDLMENLHGWEFVYDPANFIQVGEPSQKTLPLFAHRCAYYHIKDVIAETGELVPAGCGDGDLRGLIAGITKDTVLTIEPHLAVFEGYAQIDGSQMKHKFRFESKGQAFDRAVAALKELLAQTGYREADGGYIK